MTPRCAVALRLGHIDHMYQCGNVMLARDLGGGEIGLNESGVIPCTDGVNIEAIRMFVALKTLQ